jgi:hypothetical protein
LDASPPLDSPRGSEAITIPRAHGLKQLQTAPFKSRGEQRSTKTSKDEDLLSTAVDRIRHAETRHDRHDARRSWGTTKSCHQRKEEKASQCASFGRDCPQLPVVRNKTSHEAYLAESSIIRRSKSVPASCGTFSLCIRRQGPSVQAVRGQSWRPRMRKSWRTRHNRSPGVAHFDNFGGCRQIPVLWSVMSVF